MKQPTISVVIPTYNSKATIAKCLSSVRTQNYPQKNIEIILADGGSQDDTKKLVSKFDVVWIDIDPKKQNVEYNKSIGIKNAKGELLLMLDHDNILPNKNLISKMVEPFIDVKEMVGVETLHYHYDPRATLLDRYIALFGVIEPLAWYIGKADRMSYVQDGYDRKYNPEDMGKYFLVHFKKDNIPTIGANGFMIRRQLLLKNANASPGYFFPIDVNVDLINKGFNTYAFVKDSIVHLSGHGNVLSYLKRRMLFMKQYHLSEKTLTLKSVRRYSLYEEKDFWRLIFYILISLTFVIPIKDSIKGYTKIHDPAWFLHPILSPAFVVIYGYVISMHQLKISLNRLSGGMWL